ncbi:flavin reductase family protein [Salinicoccus siamensis]|uniref:Flavin reductase family protein n=1 Tax=Salinicoccus siamensis TaxID=381830 RepID=A0ABV5Z3X0_9STAP
MQNYTEKVNSFKEAMSNYPTGVNVVTTVDENDEPIGLTVNSFASVSLDPLLVLWSIDNAVSTFDKFMETDQFAVNILASNQTDIASTFAGSEEDRFSKCEWRLSEQDLPIISDVMASLQCKVFKKVEAGDHVVLIGEVFNIDVQDKAPLLYHKRKLTGFPQSFHEE